MQRTDKETKQKYFTVQAVPFYAAGLVSVSTDCSYLANYGDPNFHTGWKFSTGDGSWTGLDYSGFPGYGGLVQVAAGDQTKVIFVNGRYISAGSADGTVYLWIP